MQKNLIALGLALSMSGAFAQVHLNMPDVGAVDIDGGNVRLNGFGTGTVSVGKNITVQSSGMTGASVRSHQPSAGCKDGVYTLTLSGVVEKSVPAVECPTVYIRLNGSTVLKVPIIQANRLVVEQNGTSEIEVASINAQFADLRLSGGAELTLGGGAITNAKIDTRGTSYLKAAGVAMHQVVVAATDAASLDLRVTGSITGKAQGASTINFTGTSNASISAAGSATINRD